MSEAAPTAAVGRAVPAVVVDTNLALDVLVFSDPAVDALRAALAAHALRWLSTEGMRAELARVLGYPRIARRLVRERLNASAVLAAYDALVQPVAPPCVAQGVQVPRCRDPDDQPFVDLALAHRALLLSKDGAVMDLARRLRPFGVRVASKWPPAVAQSAPSDINFIA